MSLPHIDNGESGASARSKINNAFDAIGGKQDAGDYIVEGDSRLTDAREWTAATVGQAEAEAGTATTRRAWTAERIRQAIVAWWSTISFKTVAGQSVLGSGDIPAGIALTAVPYPVALGFDGTLEDEDEDSLPLPHNTLFRDGVPCYATVEENPDATVEIEVAIGSTILGEIEITAAGVVTWTQDAGITDDVEFDAGDIIRATGPDPADADLAGVRITIPLFAR